jgi:hypothetical protein
MKQLALAVLLTLSITSCGQEDNRGQQGDKPGQQQLTIEQQLSKYQVWEPKPHDCDFDSAPRGNKYCDYETVSNAEWEECGRPQCSLKALHMSWRKVETGTLKGQVLGISEVGIFHPAIKAQGYLISCEPPPEVVFATFGEPATNACEYSRALGLPRYKSMPDCESDAAQTAFEKVFRWASHHGVRVVPFQVVHDGLFNVSAVAGNYMVLVTGRAGSRPCIWLLSRVHLKKTVTATLFPDRVV